MAASLAVARCGVKKKGPTPFFVRHRFSSQAAGGRSGSATTARAIRVCRA